jgi:hypothetical protein
MTHRGHRQERERSVNFDNPKTLSAQRLNILPLVYVTLGCDQVGLFGSAIRAQHFAETYGDLELNEVLAFDELVQVRR